VYGRDTSLVMFPQSRRHGSRARWGCRTAQDMYGWPRPIPMSSRPFITVISSIEMTFAGCAKACEWQRNCWSPTHSKRWPISGSTLRMTILANNDVLDLWIRQTVGTARHVSGTCKMGPDGDSMAVVDQYCRVKGIQNLWVADASVMPRIPRSGGAHATVIMIGERVVDWLAAG